MRVRTYSCKGCTNKCYMAYGGEIRTYCRTTFDQPDHKGVKWFGDELRCLDYTTDPEAEDKQVRIWTPPKYERRKHDD